ncbi:MAG: hypothetical protein E7262_10550 [Lachnospiraceae bacterium]|nr:hypothetical protein [Lachnospiraceae bacterium]
MDSVISNLFLLIATGLIMLVAFIWLVQAYMKASRMKKECNEHVSAKIMAFEEKKVRGRTRYFPVYEYYYDKKLFTSVSIGRGCKTKDTLGEYETISINPTDPCEIYQSSEYADDSVLWIIFALVIVLISLVPTLYGITLYI